MDGGTSAMYSCKPGPRHDCVCLCCEVHGCQVVRATDEAIFHLAVVLYEETVQTKQNCVSMTADLSLLSAFLSLFFSL